MKVFETWLTMAVVLLLLEAAEVLTNSAVPAEEFLETLNAELDRRNRNGALASWDFLTDMTDEKAAISDGISAENAKFLQLKAKEIAQYDFMNFKNESMKRQFKILSHIGPAALSADDFTELGNAIGTMQENFSKVKICSYEDRTKCDLVLDPDVESIIVKSRNPEEMKYYWKEFYDQAGTPSRSLFEKYVNLTNKAALLNNLPSGAEFWTKGYEDDTFETQVTNIIHKTRPLYTQLHAYVRHKLRQVYGNDLIWEKGPIPMHLLGNMWAETWDNIADLTEPYPDKPSLDVTDEMKAQGYTVRKMYEKGEGFFTSLGLPSLPKEFWDYSVLEKPSDREVLCHGQAADMVVKDDKRIVMCTRLNSEYFIILHHELGHIYYFLQYQNQPSAFRDGANAGFHEAIGDAISLSVSTPKHLHKIGLLKTYQPDEQTRLNVLYKRALERLVPLPFAYTADKYRWKRFRGEIASDDYNCAFWRLRNFYSGVEPPVVRDETDFDPPAKLHIAANVDLIRYFVAFVIQFQFHKALCEKAGQYVPGDPERTLDSCDIYGSHEAGDVLKEMLSLGASKPWPDVMEGITGQRMIDAQAMIDYFEPLKVWLEAENKRTGAYIGWTVSDKCVKQR